MAQVFVGPGDLIKNEALTVCEKRRLFASCAADACVVEAAPGAGGGRDGRKGSRKAAMARKLKGDGMRLVPIASTICLKPRPADISDLGP